MNEIHQQKPHNIDVENGRSQSPPMFPQRPFESNTRSHEQLKLSKTLHSDAVVSAILKISIVEWIFHPDRYLSSIEIFLSGAMVLYLIVIFNLHMLTIADAVRAAGNFLPPPLTYYLINSIQVFGTFCNSMFYRRFRLHIFLVISCGSECSSDVRIKKTSTFQKKRCAVRLKLQWTSVETTQNYLLRTRPWLTLITVKWNTNKIRPRCAMRKMIEKNICLTLVNLI